MRQTARQIGEANADEALDQVEAFDSPAEAFDSYRQNVIDTVREAGGSTREFDDALAWFELRVTGQTIVPVDGPCTDGYYLR